MNESPSSHHADTTELDDVGRLIKIAGAREAVENERFVRVRDNVHQHWQQVVLDQSRKDRPRHFKTLAVAASLLVMVGATFMLSKMLLLPPDEILASVERTVGDVKIAGRSVAPGMVVEVNTPINTDKDSLIALRLSGGQSLRINSSSRVTVHTANNLSLETGAIYIDTAYALNKEPIVVTTPLGTAQDIGTQFQVQMTASKMVVGVRKGMVEVVAADQSGLSVDKGQFVELDVSGQGAARPLKTDDPGWDWIETVVPGFDIEGATLEAYLQWYSNERALELSWAGPESEKKARGTVLSGSIGGSSLDEGLKLVQQIAPFKYRLTDNGLWVEVE